MGRTVPTFNLSLEREMAAWQLYRRALRREEQGVFDRLFAFARQHMAECAAAARPIPFDALVLSVLLEQQKQIDALRARLGEAPPAMANGSGDTVPPTQQSFPSVLRDVGAGIGGGRRTLPAPLRPEPFDDDAGDDAVLDLPATCFECQPLPAPPEPPQP